MKFGCLVVTYNRLSKLKKAIESYENELTDEDSLIVVDNGSSNETLEYLTYLKCRRLGFNLDIIRIEKNIGATHGFSQGLKRAKELELDWCLISDDDAYPSKDFISNCKNIVAEVPNNVGAVCSKVVTISNEIQKYHRRFIKAGRMNVNEINSTDCDYEKNQFQIDLFSFVGVCLRCSVLEIVGLPREDFYIWYDDTEFSYRVSKKYDILCYPKLVTIHDCDLPKSKVGVSYKEYYGYRNRLYFLKDHFGKKYSSYYAFILFLREISNFFKCRDRIRIIKDSKRDFKNNVLSINEKYLPKE